MSLRALPNHQLGKFMLFLSICLFIIAFLTGVDLHQANANALAAPNAPAAICDLVSEIPFSECLALEALYNSTAGDSWTNKTNWLVTDTPSNWYGVTVTNNHVDYILLLGNNLSGTIPSQLGNLTYLRGISLEMNQLTGSIPSELGNLSQLQVLNLKSNQLTGSIPPELGDLESLQGLLLFNNQLNGSIPAELGDLSEVWWLHLSGNQLSGSIPSELGNMSSLTRLHLDVNQLTGAIPPELGNLTSLEQLRLNYNQLSGSIPAALGSLSALRDLYLSYNQLSGSIPAALGSLSALQTLDLTTNQLSGSLPAKLGDLSALQRLNLSGNPLSGSIPLDFINLYYLTDFNFLSTNLCEPLDQDYLDWKATVPSYSGTNVSCGTADICTLVSEIPQSECLALAALYTSAAGEDWADDTNWLVTNTPSNWYGVGVTNDHVTSIDLEDNNLSGGIPSELGNLTGLENLILLNNHLTGSIPPELGNLAALQRLNLALNQLTGSIPSELGSLSALEGLFISANQLTGSIPSDFGNLSALQWLSLAYNQLTGSIPPALGDLADLQGLYLNNNQFTGSVPLSFVNLSKLDLFHFSDTSLCEPPDQEYLDWVDTVADYQGTGVICTVPEANFSAAPLTGSAPLSVSFTNTSSGLFTSTTWVFGDGSTSTESNPTHTYYQAGTYTVSLTVSGNLGPDTETKTDYITVTVLDEEEISPAEGGELFFDFTGGGAVTVQVPAGAVGETIVLQATSATPASIPSGSELVGFSFNLTALQDGHPLAGFDFLLPVTIYVDYTDEQIAGLNEVSLRLYFWDEATETWLDAAQTCDPLSTYTRNRLENWFSIDICHLTQFAVFASIETVPEGYSLFLPAMLK